MWSQIDTHSPRVADVVIDRLEVQVVVENLNTSVVPVCNVDIAFGISRDRVRLVELTGFRSWYVTTYILDEFTVLVVLHDSRIAIAVGDENVSGRVEGHVGRPIEGVRFRRGYGLRP